MSGYADAHSPRPWRAERFFQKHSERISDGWRWGIESSDGTGFLAVLPEDDEALAAADAALIAAAPQMLRALEVVQQMCNAALSTTGGSFADLLGIESIARHAVRDATAVTPGSLTPGGETDG